MTQDEIIEMARQARIDLYKHEVGKRTSIFIALPQELAAFAKLVAAKEREACAKECEHTALRMGSEWMAQHCANAIRARGESK